MSPLSQHVYLEVSCPSCPESYTVPLEAVEESHRLLDELGPCTGIVGYECPATYFSTFVTKGTIARLDAALRELGREALRMGATPLWVEDGPPSNDAFPLPRAGTPALPPKSEREAGVGATIRKINDDRAMARELSRWEGEGGAVAS